MELQHGKPEGKKCEQSFFVRTGNLINRFPNDVDFGQIDGLNSRLLCYFWRYSDERYMHHFPETMNSYLINPFGRTSLASAESIMIIIVAVCEHANKQHCICLSCSLVIMLIKV